MSRNLGQQEKNVGKKEEAVRATEDIQAWRQQLLRGLLRALVIIGAVALVFGSYSAYETADLWLIPIYLVLYATVLVVAFWRRIPYAVQVWVVLGLMYGLGVLELTDSGLSGEGRTALLMLPFLATLFFGLRQGVFALILASLTLAAFGWAYSAGWLAVSPDPRELTVDITWWVNIVIMYVMLGTMLVVSQNYLFPRLVTALNRSRRLAQELDAERAGLEERVVERTADLFRRNTQLEAAAQVAREAAGIQDVEQLLEQTARLISDRFGFYHAGIFLLDPSGEWAVLQAASSEGGQRMLARGHRLKVGKVGIVGYVTGRGEPRVALDVGSDAVFFDNPDLPQTRSEMALPLRARGEQGKFRIIGALDVQSTEPATFTDEDVAVLQILADQLALAISNARLFQQAQESLEAERRAYGTLSRQAWSELLRIQPGLGERYDPQGILPADGRWRQEMRLAAQKSETVLGAGRPGQNAFTPNVATPIKVRGIVIGVLDAHKDGGAGGWTPQEIALLETLADQLGVALENARLYQDTQRRAIRERLTREITARMRETLDVDTVLRTAVRQIGETLGLHDVTVRLDVATELADDEQQTAHSPGLGGEEQTGQDL